MSDAGIASAVIAAPAIETRADLGTTRDSTWRFWMAQLMLARRVDEDWVKRGRKIVERYRDEREDAAIGNTENKFNILWSNVETLKPVLYGRSPKPDVQRRHKNQSDPAADMGADILQRVLEWADDIEELDDVMQQVVEDRLLPGRGVARVFYEASFGPEEAGPETDVEEEEFQAAAPGGQGADEDQNGVEAGGPGGPGGGLAGPPSPPSPPGYPTLAKTAVGYEDPARGTDHCAECQHFDPPRGCELVQGDIAPEAWCERFSAGFEEEPVTYTPVLKERAPLRYIFWEDYRESPARFEDEIWWKGYRSFLTRDQLIDRFGKELGEQIPLDYSPTGLQLPTDKGGPQPDQFKKATIWEIWDKTKKQTVWLAESYGRRMLDCLDDPLELPTFFPSPPALRATTSNNKRVPVADYAEYQDQALELDQLTERISRLTRALKVAGAYAGTEKAVLQQLVSDDSENKLIPVDDWAAFAGDKGGVANLISWLPVQQIADVLVRLYDARDRILQIIWQTTGIADIMRGETNPVETLGAQQLKSQFATRRISRAQKDVARFVRDLMRLRAAVIARHFAPQSLASMTGLPLPMPPMPPPPPMLIPAPQPLPMPAAAPGGAGPAPGAPPAPAAPPGGGMPAGPGPGMPPPPMMPPAAAMPPAAVRPPVPMVPPATAMPAPWRQAPDGRFYRPDPMRPGRFLMRA